MTDILHEEQLKLQLSELEMLRSMYPTQEEFAVREVLLLNTQRYLDGKREAFPNQLEYTITIRLESGQGKLEISCEYPLEYPQVSPNVFVRCDQMSRSSQKQFNDCVQEFVKTLECGELCINSVISWIQEHAEEYKGTDDDKGTVDHLEPKVKVKFTGVSRLWIYSHHIYRKELLRKIPESAKELDLTGFCLPGKPGIICVEGFKENCDEYWQRLKYPNWKHISCKHREDSPFTDPTNVNDCLRKFRLFKVFETLTFEAHGDYGLRNDYHMDLGQFRDFLLEHGCEHMFQIFFGLEAKSSR